jgi:hypothetical protein
MLTNVPTLASGWLLLLRMFFSSKCASSAMIMGLVSAALLWHVSESVCHFISVFTRIEIRLQVLTVSPLDGVRTLNPPFGDEYAVNPVPWVLDTLLLLRWLATRPILGMSPQVYTSTLGPVVALKAARTACMLGISSRWSPGAATYTSERVLKGVKSSFLGRAELFLYVLEIRYAHVHRIQPKL